MDSVGAQCLRMLPTYRQVAGIAADSPLQTLASMRITSVGKRQFGPSGHLGQQPQSAQAASAAPWSPPGDRPLLANPGALPPPHAGLQGCYEAFKRRLNASHAVSCVPGTQAVSDKAGLAASLAAAYGPAAWHIVPRSYRLPGEYAALAAHIKQV